LYCVYADFNSIGKALLLLLQVSLSANWHIVVFNLADQFDTLLLPALFFDLFEFLCIFFFALVGGLVWEVFNVIDET
jgi:hypothetical protein